MRTSSKSRLRDDDRKINNDKKTVDLKTNKHAFTKPATCVLLKSNEAKPRLIPSKGVSGSSTNPSRKSKCSKNKKNISKSPEGMVERSLENVNYTPELKHNLLSISQICDKGYSTHFTDTKCLILKPGIFIPDEWILVSEHNVMLWHYRLGHAYAKNPNRLAKNEMVRGLHVKDFITFEKCVACAQGKHHNDVSGSCSGSKEVIEDEEEDVVYRPPLVPSTTPTVDEVVTSTSSGLPCQRTDPTNEAIPLTPAERDFMIRDTSAATHPFMELLFPESITNEYVASTSNDSRSSKVFDTANDGHININNLPVMLNDISQELPTKIQRDHPIKNVNGQLGDDVRTRRQSRDVNTCLYSCFISQIEPKNIDMALNEPSWVDAMHEDLNQFDKLRVWKLIELPKGKKSCDTRWIDVKTTFLYDVVKEETYIDQPPGFVNSKFPNHIYKLDKALYGLHQAPRAWYAILTKHLLKHGYTRGTIDQAMFIKHVGADQILVQIYVDDNIFGPTCPQLCKEFEVVMKKRFEMSSLGEMTMFLGL
ncbi:uncharacterized protein LOC111917686 [Lactuca sativa]|uniref:uncharacterized protein LOC111917686 n=1 Tax=Lactuca sativa TaxID=4236 RepID=UPI0022B06256|nr:uncharacterized protein LOC111917686 [Lactuca sativa]